MRITGVLTLFIALAVQAAAQTPVTPPALPAEQEQRLSAMPADTQIYERFRYWAGFQPPDVQKVWETYYDRYLQQTGVAQEERARRIKIIETEGHRLEVDRWNRILTAEKPTSNTNPNAFLVEVIKVERLARHWT